MICTRFEARSARRCRAARWTLLAAATMVFAACGERAATPPPPAAPTAADAAAHVADVDAWKKHRDTRLRAADGWTTLVGLSWLRPGANRVGGAPTADVVLPADRAPTDVGILVLDEATREVSWRSVGGSAVAANGQPIRDRALPLLADTAAGGPTVLTLGSLTFYVIERGDRLGVRVKDSESEVRRRFPGMDYYPLDPSWRIVARFEKSDPPTPLRMPNVLGMIEDVPSPGVAVFERDGRTYRLRPILEPGETDYFYVFGDRTNGTETYGAGRFLYSKPADENSTVVLDFNKSYNPPCVFTAYATCQIPPAENKLDLAIRAGERRYTGPTAGLAEDH